MKIKFNDEEESQILLFDTKKTIKVKEKFKRKLKEKMLKRNHQKFFNLISQIMFFIMLILLLLHFYILNLDKRGYKILEKWLNFTNERETKHKKVFKLNNVKIYSNFDSGNLASLRQKKAFHFEMKVGSEEYFIQVPSNEKQSKAVLKNKEILEKKEFNRNWFMFKVEKLDQPVTLYFKISNLSFDKNFLKNGVVPVVKQDDEGYEEWQEIDEKSILEVTDSGDLSLRFSYTYDPIIDKTLVFALTYPWSCSRDRIFYEMLCLKYFKRKKKLKITKDKIGNSQNKRNLDLYWISDGIIELKELKKNGTKSLNVKKKIVIFMSRTHGSEAIGSMGLGFFVEELAKKLENDEIKNWNLRETVIAVIPLLNPDGVDRGYATVDYEQKDPEEALEGIDDGKNEIWQVKKFIEFIQKKVDIEDIFFFNSRIGNSKVVFSTSRNQTKREEKGYFRGEKGEKYEILYKKQGENFIDKFLSNSTTSTRKITITFPTIKETRKRQGLITLKKVTYPSHLLKPLNIKTQSTKILKLLTNPLFLKILNPT